MNKIPGGLKIAKHSLWKLREMDSRSVGDQIFELFDLHFSDLILSLSKIVSFLAYPRYHQTTSKSTFIVNHRRGSYRIWQILKRYSYINYPSVGLICAQYVFECCGIGGVLGEQKLFPQHLLKNGNSLENYWTLAH